MERGNNNGFNPYRDSHGRYAAGGSAARTPHPDARETYRQGAVRVLQPPARADGTYWAELWHGDQFISETRLTRAHRTEMAALRAEADRLAGPTPAATPAAAPAPAQTPARPAPAPTPPPAKPAPPKAVAWRPELTPEEADVWAKDSVIKDTLFHSVRERDMYRMKDVLRKGFDANHEGAHGFPRWGTGILPGLWRRAWFAGPVRELDGARHHL